MKNLQQLKKAKPFTEIAIKDCYFKYYLSDKSNGDIKGAARTKQTLQNNLDSDVWREYEILTKIQYIKKWMQTSK